MDNYTIAESDKFLTKIDINPYSSVYKKILDYVYPILRENPFYGTNIKKLKGEFKDIYRYRIGIFRLFYSIDIEDVVVFITNIEQRKDSYK